MENNTELKITKEQILAMAKKCPTAEAVLREGFPTAFEEDKSVERVSLEADFLWIRDTGKLKKRAFGLSRSFDWRIEEVEGTITLIPTRK